MGYEKNIIENQVNFYKENIRQINEKNGVLEEEMRGIRMKLEKEKMGVKEAIEKEYMIQVQYL